MPGELDHLRRAMVAAATQATRTFAEHVLGESQREVPIEEGTLAGTGTVDVEHSAYGATATISYGTPYAARQHEELGWQHAAGRKAKYLEDPLKRNINRYAPLVAAAIERVARG